MAAAAAVGVPLIARGAERGRASDPQPGAAPEPKGTPLTGTLRIGLIGCGGRGTGAALQALKADPDSKLVAMGDIFSERIDSSLAEIAKALGDKAEGRLDVPQERRFTGFDCHDKVLAAGVDVVLLCGYPAFRPAQYRAAIEAGKHVFVEKPLAVDGPGVRHVLETARMARSKGLSSLVGFCWRYNTGMREAYRRIHEGPIGDVVSAHTTYYTGTLPKRKRQPEWSDVEFQLRNWWHFAWISGDHIVEQAIHSIDRMAWAMGDRLPRQVVCLGGRQARTGEESGNVFDHFSAVFEYEDGLRAFHGTRQMDGCPSDNNDYIFGTKGSALVDGWRPLYQAKDPSGKVIWQRTDKDPDMYQCEHNELFAGIRSGNVINDTERGAHSTLMAIMARTSAYSGQTVTWEQAMNSEEKLGPDIVVFGPMPVAPVPVPGRKQQAPPSKG
jgi:predicted dehydrogenase